ncbi:cytochrome c oxidase accessory protein CcoG [Pinisolibacter aquiterrae]|uniref:cytochrome c oxidase accessory protein CcoG n=1 Tax=Pinisolibacter aquiterrae TaxID=2815579 RepID=UPI001C3CCF7F|nr:cytochrome c oxidase accessory protein CcoG [Pinisolibacter aquiterrae]MBV5262836.1 cytochrome c oxidase accessory protein CcoG [Pinisolibacter aquiterrae]MCC8236450.1 cytochrome c oxidase accessory protein CcoG [Pinisolibacter aquiterrae]
MRAFGADERGGVPLRLEETKIYPATVHGPYRRLKWVLTFAALAVYYLVPFLRFDRGPGRPDQAVLFDFVGQRFWFFGLEIWPQEVYYVTGLMIVAALALFLTTALVGRAWCGYLCPQTVWTDLFRRVERAIEGERREQMRRDAGPWTFDRLLRKAATHAAWLVIAMATGGAFVFWFTDAPKLVAAFARGEPPAVALVWIGILTTTTYLLAGFSREQVCLYMCPWPRIQAALTDEWALNVTYRWDRGEPRGRLKSGERVRAEGGRAGDCVDCGRCVAVCPTGVDIRDGLQMGCIQCGLCIDACDEVMTRIGRPTRLIAYDSDAALEARVRGETPVHRFVRPRTVMYAALIVLVSGVLVWRLATRPAEMLAVLHDRNPIAVVNSDGSIRNAYTLRLSNMAAVERSFEISVSPLPKGARIEAATATPSPSGGLVVTVPADSGRDVRLLVTVPADGVTSPRMSLWVTARSADARDLTVEDHFAVP